MRHSGHRLVRHPAWRAACLALALTAAAERAGAREVTIQGQQLKGFGRIELRFDQPTKVRVRSQNGVVVIGFVEPARIRTERLAGEIPGAISAVRRDPDDTGLRLAVVTPVRTSVLEAGERVFVDLLPPTWTGLPPSLPAEVVAELAERARVAESKLREDAARRTAARKPVLLRLAELPTLTRLVFEPPTGTAIRFKVTGGRVEAEFDGSLSLDGSGPRPKGMPGLAAFSATETERGLTVKVAAAPDRTAHAFAEDGALVVDLAKPGAKPETAAGPGPVAPPPARPAAAAPRPAEPAPAPAPRPVERSSEVPSRPAADPAPPPSVPPPARAEAPTVPAAAATRPPGAVVPVLTPDPAGGSILFPFLGTTPAAAFERGGRITLVFETRDRLDVAALPAAAAAPFALEPVRQDGDLAIVTLKPATARVPRFLPEGTGWRLALDGRAGAPPDEARIARSAGPDGQGEIVVALPAASTARWLDAGQDGAVAVVTATGRAMGLANERRFVEFTLAPSLHGIVVESRADDVTVGLGRGGVIISRRAGLSLSSVGTTGEAGSLVPLALDRADWVRDGAGDRLVRYRELVAAAAEAPRPGRAEARMQLARFLVANGMDLEATSLLALARQEDAAFARRRETLLLSGIAAVRAERPVEARAFLGAAALADDGEAALWRAVLDGRERNWTKALAGIRRAGAILDRYPEEVVGALRQVAFKAAIETGDLPAAEAALLGMDRLPAGTVPHDDQDLARARVDEASGRLEIALKTYEKLALDGSRRVAAEAALRAVALASRTGRIDAPEAIHRLEVLAVSWRGDETELRTLVELAHLYGAAARWRDMFSTTRRADLAFPQHEETRALHDETTRRFETLFLGEEGAGLSAVEVLALYYDFREFAPIGRRGDEIVRRLADRLVELDLLDQAADLLQHQVDKRLTGAGRAAVAARLAAIRLMSGKPMLALTTLQTTRLAELPASLRRFRLLLEAQAEADLTRVDLALEILEDEAGPEAARLRAGILFGASRWREAGEAYEALVGRRWQSAEALSDRDRADVIRAALADALAEEAIALDRLRTKFTAKMADSPDAKTFDALLRPGASRTREFRTAMREAGRTDTLRRLLAERAAGTDPEAEEPVRGEGAPERAPASTPG